MSFWRADRRQRATRILVVVTAMGFLVGPVMVFGWFSWLIPRRTGTREFYGVAAQAIPTLLVALAIELQVFVKRLRHLVAIDAIVVASVSTAFFVMAVGEIAALDALTCEPYRQCTNVAHFQAAYLGLVFGITLVLSMFVLALYHGTRGSEASSSVSHSATFPSIATGGGARSRWSAAVFAGRDDGQRSVGTSSAGHASRPARGPRGGSDEEP